MDNAFVVVEFFADDNPNKGIKRCYHNYENAEKAIQQTGAKIVMDEEEKYIAYAESNDGIFFVDIIHFCD